MSSSTIPPEPPDPKDSDRPAASSLVRPTSDDQLQRWATSVTRSYRKVVKSTLETGEKLLRYKQRCSHGAFERMFTGHPQAVLDPIPFSIRTGQRFMAVASHPILTQATHGSSLPSSWRTLYELSRLPLAVVQAALEDGRIHPEMERQDVALLLTEPRERPLRVEPTSLRARISAQREISDMLQRLWHKYPEERAYLLQEVAALEAETKKKPRGRRLSSPVLRDILGKLDAEAEQETQA